MGYCTNVHAGATWELTKRNLETHALEVKRLVSPHEPMGIGLWLSARAAREVIEENRIEEMRDWLSEHGLFVFTMNGFPFGDFHDCIVKHRVYRPHWGEQARANYTRDLIAILVELIPERSEGSISTLPLGWRADFNAPTDASLASSHLRSIAIELGRIEQREGKLIHIDLEPEPGCQLQRAEDVTTFFLRELFDGPNEAIVRRHIRVCHDICHAAVMFEEQTDVFAHYHVAGIEIGKVQVSNAVRVDLRGRSDRERAQAIAQLSQFSEQRYLHQTTVAQDGALTFHEDLSPALRRFGVTDRAGDEWRVHFHVPVFLESFGLLHTTQHHIAECFELLRGSQVKHWEVETYAWNVLPVELQAPTLAEGIARELQWVKDQFADDRNA